MAITQYQYQKIFDGIYGLKNNEFLLTNKAATDQFSAALRFLMLDAQVNALVGADANAITFLIANRQFILNPTVADVKIEYNGKTALFPLVTSLCMHPDEHRFFMQKVAEQGLPLVDDPAGTAYFSGNGGLEFFYW